MINAFIASKDRASQLLLLLESLNKNAPNMFLPHILYKSSNEEFAKGYNIVKQNKAAENVVWIEENHGEEEFYSFLKDNANKNKLICLFSDDCIFYRKTNIDENLLRSYFEFGPDNQLFCFTYRLGKNITVKDYVINEQAILPNKILEGNKILAWRWDSVDFWQLHGFATGFDGYIYRSKDLLDLSDNSPFDGKICFWEKMICQKFLEKKSNKILMACPITSEVFVQQINTVHEYGHRTNNVFNLSAQELNQRLLDGYKIDIDSLDFSGVNCTHGELEFKYEHKNTNK